MYADLLDLPDLRRFSDSDDKCIRLIHLRLFLFLVFSWQWFFYFFLFFSASNSISYTNILFRQNFKGVLPVNSFIRRATALSHLYKLPKHFFYPDLPTHHSMVEPTASQSFRDLLQKLVLTPEYFTPDDIKLALELLFTQNDLHPAQIGAFMTALHIHRVEARPESLVAAAKVLRGRALKAAIEDLESDFVVDIVGTGGDGHNAFNVSTTAAIVAAGAGARVIKVLFLVPTIDL